MRLHRLRVEQLRQFRQPLEILALEPGLNPVSYTHLTLPTKA